MRIKELHLKTWKVIRDASFVGLSDFVVIAGPNGVGKTKIKDAIVYIFQNNGNPPPGSTVVLEATNQEEVTAWKNPEITLPQNFWNSFFGTQHKRLKSKSRLIQIDSNRSIDTVNFQQLTFSQIGNPEDESVDHGYGFNNVKGRYRRYMQNPSQIKE